jgi:hypothetical protein
MIQRYYGDEEGFNAWIEGLNDAVEFLDNELYNADDNMSWRDFKNAITELAMQIAFAYEERLEPDDNLRGDTLSIPTGGSDEDSWPTIYIVSRSTWVGKNFGSLEQLRASGSVQPDGQPRDSNTHTSCECKDCLDRHDREVRYTEIPEPKSSGPIIRQRRKEEQGSIFGPVRKWYSPNNRGRKPRRTGDNG